MNALFEWLGSFVDIILSVFKLLITLVDSLLWLIANIPQLLSGVIAGFAYAPSFILPFLMGSLAILVVFMIIKLL